MEVWLGEQLLWEFLYTFDKNLFFQLDIWAQVLSTKFGQHLDLFLPMIMCNPKYFSMELEDLILAIRVRFCWTSIGVFLLKNKEVFSLLSCWPEASSYWVNSEIKLFHSMELIFQNERLWFTKNKWSILIEPKPMGTLKILSIDSALWRRHDRVSETRMKRYGDNGLS